MKSTASSSLKGYKHTPFASISEEFEQNSIVCMAPSKTFNLAGLEASSIIIPNKKLRESFNEHPGGHGARPQPLRSVPPWKRPTATAMNGWSSCWTISRATWTITLDYFKERIPKIKVIKPQGTYLVWLDCRALGWTI